jgi:DNA mismatch repair protein MSH4
MQAETKYDNARRYYLRVSESDFAGRPFPDILVNRYRKKGYIECQTLDLMKLNQRIEDSHQEIVLMSDSTVQELLDNIRGQISSLFRVCESIAMLDMIASFVHLATTSDYTRPEISDCLVIQSGRHPVREKVSGDDLPELEVDLLMVIPRCTKITNSSRTMFMQLSRLDSKSSPVAT